MKNKLKLYKCTSFVLPKTSTTANSGTSSGIASKFSGHVSKPFKTTCSLKIMSFSINFCSVCLYFALFLSPRPGVHFLIENSCLPPAVIHFLASSSPKGIQTKVWLLFSLFFSCLASCCWCDNDRVQAAEILHFRGKQL